MNVNKQERERRCFIFIEPCLGLLRSDGRMPLEQELLANNFEDFCC